jgi:hypothetical protein
MEQTHDNNTTTTTRPWTTTELTTLQTHAHLGAHHLAALLNRSLWSIRCAAADHRISLRPPGEHRGSILGQPRGTTIDPTIRERITAHPALAMVIDAEARAALTGQQTLCPNCATWPVAPGRDCCRPCWINGLTEAHRHQLAIELAQRANARARQEKHRALSDAPTTMDHTNEDGPAAASTARGPASHQGG